MHTVVFKKQALAQMVSCFETQTHRETCIVKYNFSKLAKEQVPGRKPTTLVQQKCLPYLAFSSLSDNVTVFILVILFIFSIYF